MVKALLGFAVAMVLTLAFGARAQAFQFCPVVPNGIQALTFKATDAYVQAKDSRFGVELQAQAPITASGTVNVATGDAIYHVPFKDVKFVPDTAHSSVAGFISSSEVYFALSKPETVNYIWVSPVSVDGSDPVDCELFPFQASHDFFNQTFTQTNPQEPHRLVDERILGQAAAATMQTAQLDHKITRTCRLDDRKPQLVSLYAPNVQGHVPDGPTLVAALVYISAYGRPVDAELYAASSYDYLNKNLLDRALHSTYAPAIVDCMPAAGVYLLRALYSK